MSSDPLIASLSAALDARPDDLPLRLHLAALLLDAGRAGEAIAQIGQALARDPGNGEAQALMQRALGGPVPPAPAAPQSAAPQSPAAPTAPAQRPAPAGPDVPPAADGSDPLAAYEQELADIVPPRFARAGDEPEPVTGDADRVYDVEVSGIRLADVGGMVAVKERLELAFLGPLRNPELRRMYGKSLRGGLMLYGPPGCGKTFLARAVAGEMGAKFISLSIVDVLDMWMGNSERNLHELFQAARRNAPCVLFLDEIDALGHKRSQVSSSSMRTLGNQLLAELDGMEGNNEGVFVLAATNTPWDVDPALRRPGRLDRVVLVLPPDADARRAILEYHLRDRPIAGIDLRKVVAATEDFSGADLAHLCETAAEFAMADSVRTGEVRMIEQRDLERALKEVRPSTRPWMATARNVAMFANEGGVYDDLVAYLKRRKLL
ncbi:ATPase family associated with various cellular activities (AAA) [Micromonospora echinaurantiaca]|uniref:ATPase family associated with various cellular activities (AAA) n=1 Tax=Micromonospora echinaurantiaca TaxID=47857 RepID=A0A1C5JIS3_9ACTN|nr:ATP-binding protein [Micromonospora echinaurantiaca]SCG70467.1 ATPase family associated with various cellular activities (AAA) [Micromonospora echinaurantiaca]